MFVGVPKYSQKRPSKHTSALPSFHQNKQGRNFRERRQSPHTPAPIVVQKTILEISPKIKAVFQVREPRLLARLNADLHKFEETFNALFELMSSSIHKEGSENLWKDLQTYSLSIEENLDALITVDHPALWHYLRTTYDQLGKMHIRIKHALLATSKGFEDTSFGLSKKKAENFSGYTWGELPKEGKLRNEVHHIDRRSFGGTSIPEMLVRLNNVVHKSIHKVIDDQQRERDYLDLRNNIPFQEVQDQHQAFYSMAGINASLLELSLRRFDDIEQIMHHLHLQYYQTLEQEVRHEERTTEQQIELEELRRLDSQSEIMRHAFIRQGIQSHLRGTPVLLKNLHHFFTRERFHHGIAMVEEFKIAWSALSTEEKTLLFQKVPSFSPLITVCRELLTREPLPFIIYEGEHLHEAQEEEVSFAKLFSYMRPHIETITEFLDPDLQKKFPQILRPLFEIHLVANDLPEPQTEK